MRTNTFHYFTDEETNLERLKIGPKAPPEMKYPCQIMFTPLLPALESPILLWLPSHLTEKQKSPKSYGLRLCDTLHPFPL